MINPAALHAAYALAAQGKHVHFVADGETRCLRSLCTTNSTPDRNR